ncbi:LuxR C-terminal-related transcriptional regulator [Nitrogeniibacter aestuarii]|uniref:LuxR C-terminal-related transcriptional regulator n=1 Tax=Nitrogeniibacter aestuarii TaxID=2815343 RepID=UPI001D1178F6|nr:LuxR C-terminal-related transcriptional regulator [Nitrogeniibacter aestuarii]
MIATNPADTNKTLDERLVAAKLVPSPPSTWAVTRTELLALLDTATDKKLVTLTAPPGFGKTTLLAQWARQTHVTSPVWLSLDQYDSSAHMLLRYLVAAFERADASLGARAARLLEADPLSPAHVPASLLLADISACRRPMTLILDDIDRVTDAEAIELLNLLVDRSPPTLGFVVAGTHCRPIRPQALLSEGRLGRIESSHLRFSLHETEVLIHRAGIPDPQMAVRLRRESDGWITGMRLLLSTLDPGSPPSLRVPSARQRQDIHEFFHLSVLPRLPEAQVTFLESISVLDRFNAALANAVLERTDAAQMIESLDAQGVFIQRLDSADGWYRLDHLAHFSFSRRLTSRHPGRDRAINLKAAHWFVDNGYWRDAVARAMAAGAPEQAAGWLAQRAMSLIESSDLRSVKDCLALLPDALVSSHPALLLAKAWAHTLSLETRFSEACLHQLATGAPSTSPVDDGESVQVEIEAIQAMNLTLMDDSEGGLRVARRVLARQPAAGSWTWRMARTAEVIGLIYRGEFSVIDQLQASLVTTRDKARDMPTYARVYMKSVLGLGYLIRGEFARAEHILTRAYRLAVDTIGRESAAAALPAGYLTTIYYEWDRLDALDHLLEQHPKEIVATTAIGAAARFASIKVRRRFQRGSPDEAKALIRAGQRVAIKNVWPRMMCYIQAETVRMAVREGNLAEAAMAFDTLNAEWSPSSHEPMGTELENWALHAHAAALLALARGLPEQATSTLEPLIDRLARLDMQGLSLSPRLLLAMAWRAQGNDATALDIVEAALHQGAASYAIRPFVDAPEGMRDLLEQFVAERLSRSPALSWFMQTLFGAFDQARAPVFSTAPGVSASEEALTPREQEMLAGLCEGMSNKQLANHLGVSQETVKWHLKNIYAKLRVRSRSQAIIIGREILCASRPETKPK